MNRTALAVLLGTVLAAPLLAQAPPPAGVGSWYTATTYVVKPGMMDDFRALVIKEINPAAKKGGLTQAQVWRFSTGNTNRVLRIVLHNSLADRDGPSAVEKGMGADGFRAFTKRRDALLVASTIYIGRQRLDMGLTTPGAPAPRLAERYVVRIAQGRNAEYLKYVQAFLAAAKKSGHQRAAGQVVFGPEAGTFVSNTYYSGWADLEKGRPPDRVMSASELTAFNQLNSNGLITVVSRDVMTYEGEMSVTATPSSR
jgi:hypothetical protein